MVKLFQLACIDKTDKLTLSFTQLISKFILLKNVIGFYSKFIFYVHKLSNILYQIISYDRFSIVLLTKKTFFMETNDGNNKKIVIVILFYGAFNLFYCMDIQIYLFLSMFVVCFMRTIMCVCCVVLLILNVGGFLNIYFFCSFNFRGNFIDIGIKKRKGKIYSILSIFL